MPRRLLPRPAREVGKRGSVLLLLQVSGDVLPDED